MATCKSCGASIEWIKTTGGKPMPVDAKVITIVTDAGNVVRGRESHFATCPDAAAHRKGKPIQGSLLGDGGAP